MPGFIITIDGPAASGKSTVARMLAKKLDAVFLDTGAMYRAVTLAAMHAGADLDNENSLMRVLNNTDFRFVPEADKMKVFIDGSDVTEAIRSPEVTANARSIASAPKIRERLVDMQRSFARSREKIVTEGRDQGTVAFPNASVKFFLTADIEERARRRRAELLEKNIDQPLDEIRLSIEKRDLSDRNRSFGPLRHADDMIVLDTTDLTLAEVLEKLLLFLQQKCLEKK